MGFPPRALLSLRPIRSSAEAMELVGVRGVDVIDGLAAGREVILPAKTYGRAPTVQWKSDFNRMMEASMEWVVYACDVGTTRLDRADGKGFAWARVHDGSSENGTSIAEAAERISSDLAAGRSVALGFECPLYIPVPNDESGLSKARPNEGSRTFFVGAGAIVLSLGLQQASWLMRRLLPHRGSVHFTQDAKQWRTTERQTLLCWEAFVTNKEGPTHGWRDALGAAAAFDARSPASEETHLATEEAQLPGGEAVLSLIGAAALWSGWTSDLNELRRRCVVVTASPTIDR